jgi:hypothetical protein
VPVGSAEVQLHDPCAVHPTAVRDNDLEPQGVMETRWRFPLQRAGNGIEVQPLRQRATIDGS